MSKRIGAAVLFVTALGLLLNNFCSHEQPEIIVVDESFYYRIEFINFDEKEKALIREAMTPLAAPRCNDAFRRAGLRSPLEVLLKDGVVIRPSYDLYRFTVKELGLVDERTRRVYMDQFSGGNAQAGTVSAVIYGTRRTLDGRARVFLHDTAFLESTVYRRLSLRQVMVHEFIHVTGQPPTPGWFGCLRRGRDLAGFAPYDEIMEACR
jgi:hypothetical protein